MTNYDYRNTILSMDEKKRIFSKEALTYEDLAKLYALNYSSAGKLARAIKFKVGDRLKRRGVISIADYAEYFGFNINDLRG